MGSQSKLVLAFSLFLTFSAFTSAVSIETLQSPFDSQTVSPSSQVAQVVRLVDAEGEPINSSSLENRSNLQFSYIYDGNESEVGHLLDGYYYAHIETGETVREIEYEVIDNSISGELNETEDLETGKLDVDILSNYTGDLEAGEEIEVEATVEDLTQYLFVDVDNSATLSSDDIVVVDEGGSGTFSRSADPVFAGEAPENVEILAGTNPWSEDTHRVSINDSDWEDGGWNPGSDLIVLDHDSGGTVSTQPDMSLSTGSNSFVDTASGTEFEAIDGVSSSLFYVSSSGNYDTGDPVIYDNDSDGIYTARPDPVIAGEEPPEGSEVTHEDNMPDGWRISSYDGESGDGWDEDEDFLAIDEDNDSVYTSRADILLGGQAPEEGTELNRDGYSDWVDQVTSSPTAGDLEVHDENETDDWNPSEDAIWIEEGSNNGYQPGEDTAVYPESIPTGTSPTETGNQFDQWETISVYDEGDGSSYDPSVDSIIRDFHGGGTYSASEDEKVAGTVPVGFSGGSGYTVEDGFVDDWELDARRPVDAGGWSSSRDTILIDRNEGGTYSASADQVVNAEGEVTEASGTDLQALNEIDSENIMWSDLDGDGRYDSGDEIFRDLDKDDQYTSQADEHLAGVSLDVAGQGTDLRTYNNWQNEDEPVLFHDEIQGDAWNPMIDAVIHDTDSDGVYTARGDVVVKGRESQAEAGSTLYITDRKNFTTPDLNAWVTSGQNTTGPIELGRNSEGNYSDTLEVPQSHDTDMLLQIEAEDQTARINGMASRVLETRAQGIGFDALKSGIDLNVKRKGNYSRNVTLKNYLATENTINISWSEEIENITHSSHDNVELPPQGNSTVRFTFNVSELEDAEGEIEFTETETSISESIDIDIITPDCVQRTNVLCRKGIEDLFIHSDERGEIERSLELQNLVHATQEINLSVEGNISDYTTFENSTVELNRTETVDLTFNPQVPGNFSGTIELETSGETMEIDTEMIANFTERESGFELTPSSLSIENLPRSNDASREIRMTNTGTLQIERVEVNSESFELSSEPPQTLASSDSKNFTVNLQSVQSESGDLNVTAETSQENISRDLSISVSLVPQLSEMKNTINSRVSSLRSQANSSSTLTRLTDLQTETSAIETQWDQGNYGRANQIYRSTTSKLDSIQSQVGGSEPSNPGGGGNGGTTSPGSEQGGSAGGMIIVILVLLVFILGAGFVVYTSYYPEEGDPLYDVLGDRE